MGLSPMMQDYVNTKEKYKDSILFYRLGDFYEMFFEDAKIVAKELELTLTSKACGLEEKAPMAGVPHHSAEIYIAKLLSKGYKVAICEQMENAKEVKGLVRREVVKVVTPGTVTETELLKDSENNYILAIYESEDLGYSISALDVSTGEFLTTEIKFADFSSKAKKTSKIKEEAFSAVLDEIARFNPKEILVQKSFIDKDNRLSHIENILDIYVTIKDESYFDISDADIKKLLFKYTFNEVSLDNSLKRKDNSTFKIEMYDNVHKKISEKNDSLSLFESYEESETSASSALDSSEKSLKNNEKNEEKNAGKLEEEKNEEKNEEKLEEELENGADVSESIEKERKKDLITTESLSAKAIIAMDRYIYETQKMESKHIQNIYMYSFEGYMALDTVARRNLELTKRMSDGSKKGTLLWVLDKTNTSMGARMLIRWINDPLLSKKNIDKRLSAVDELKKEVVLRGEVISVLKKIYDIERISSKISYSTVNGKDMIALKNSIMHLPSLKKVISNVDSKLLKEISLGIDGMEDIFSLIDSMIVDEPPLTITEGNLIKEDFNKELKRLRTLDKSGKEWIANLEATERERTGIKNLKIGYNKVFGYYIEITKSQVSKAPSEYIRKQTLTGSERYVTPELKTMEEELLNAEEKANKLEYSIFNELKNLILSELPRIKKTSDNIAKLDVLSTFASVAEDNNYVKPNINTKGDITLKNSRHPVVEKTIKDEQFVENDCNMDLDDETVLIITGPNMSGKSTYMRQVALIVLMAQIGSFVPASEANISIVDKIYTRIGASDDLSTGQSTFMMEMNEVSNILKGASENSLVILDEVGRGTSTFDGMSIARAVVEHIANKKEIGCKTLFATHYHELTELEYNHDNIKNYHVEAKEFGDNIIFLRKVLRGGTDDSYGIHVAKLAGVPASVVKNAGKILKKIESEKKIVEFKEENTNSSMQTSMFEMKYSKLIDRIGRLDINNITPIGAFEILTDIIEEAKE